MNNALVEDLAFFFGLFLIIAAGISLVLFVYCCFSPAFRRAIREDWQRDSKDLGTK